MKGRIKAYRRSRGFTFIEIMVVVAILALLAGLILPRFMGQADKAKIDSTRVQIRSLSQALDLYKLDNGFYPTTDQGLRALYEEPQSEPVPKKWKQYIEAVPRDAWENEFIYIQPGNYRDFDLYSLGPDGQDGTEDDITNWTREDEERRR